MDNERIPAQNSGAGTDRRAVSEVLSYALIFGLIVASIAIVSVGGMNGLETVRTNEQLSNAERAFDVLHDNLRAVHAEGAPSRATEVSLGDSQIFFGENITMRVSVGGDTNVSTIRPIIFRVEGERQLVYEAGTVIRQSRDGGVVLNPPPFALTKDTNPESGQVHLPIVQTTSSNVQSMGSTTVLVRGKSTNREVLRSYADGGPTLDYIEIESPRYEIWMDYFEGREYCDSVSNPSGTKAQCDIHSDFADPGQLYVTEQAITIDLIN